MKGIYVSPNVSDNPGINQKILKQIEAFSEAGIELNLLMDSKRGILKKIQTTIPFFSIQFDNFVLEESKKYDFIYIRKPYYFDGDFIKKLSILKKNGVKIILEIPTFPYDSEFKHKLLMASVILKDKIWRKKLKNYVSRIVTFSDDHEIFGIKTIQTCNAFEFKSRGISQSSFTNDNNIITLIAVANIEKWHGYDRLITGLSEYYLNKKDNDPDFTVYIVGNGNNNIIQQYKKMIHKNNLKDKIILTGIKIGKELDDLFQISDMGIDSLGRHRSKVYYNSSLKSKEYLGRGLPIVSGVTTELDKLKNSFEYYMRVPADDTPINFMDINRFFQKSYSGKNVEEVKDSIRDFGEKNFSFRASVEPIIEYLEGNKENDGDK